MTAKTQRHRARRGSFDGNSRSVEMATVRSDRVALPCRQPAHCDLPPPKDLGEAFMAGWVIKKADTTFARFFLLEHDYVLAKKANSTTLTEREGILTGTTKDSKHGQGSPITGNFEVDAVAFIDCF